MLAKGRGITCGSSHKQSELFVQDNPLQDNKKGVILKEGKF